MDNIVHMALEGAWCWFGATSFDAAYEIFANYMELLSQSAMIDSPRDLSASHTVLSGVTSTFSDNLNQ